MSQFYAQATVQYVVILYTCIKDPLYFIQIRVGASAESLIADADSVFIYYKWTTTPAQQTARCAVRLPLALHCRAGVFTYYVTLRTLVYKTQASEAAEASSARRAQRLESRIPSQANCRPCRIGLLLLSSIYKYRTLCLFDRLRVGRQNGRNAVLEFG